MSVRSPGGCRYLVLFVDDFSGHLFAYPIKEKDDNYGVMQSVLVECAAVDHKLRTLRSDNAVEFKSTKMVGLLNKHLVKQQFTTPYVPAENGRIERQNRNVIEAARTMLNAANLPKTLWAEAVKASCNAM